MTAFFFFFLLGNRRTVKDVGPVGTQTCSHCHNETVWRLSTVTSWITLFFIPVIPYSTKHFASCPICGMSTSLSGARLEQVSAVARIGRARELGQMSAEQAAEALRQLQA